MDLVNDTVLISDPLFTIRETIQAFFNTDHVQRLNKVALTSGIFCGLIQASELFPDFCETPAAILRKLESLTHFTLVLLEEGLLMETHRHDDNSEVGYDISDQDEKVQYYADEDAEPDTKDTEGSLDNSTANQVESQVMQRARLYLEHWEKKAWEKLSKGYIRHPGNLHFESPIHKISYMADWVAGKQDITNSFDEEKAVHPEWSRPRASVMMAQYGLRLLGDFDGPTHLAGDYPIVQEDIVLESLDWPLPEGDRWRW